jgi:hypothetical protein
MQPTDHFPNLGDDDIRLFRLFCETAVEQGNLLSPIRTEDVTSHVLLSDMGKELCGQSIALLREQSYLTRSGPQHVAVTVDGFDRYANAYGENYGEREQAVRNALATVEGTDTTAIVSATGEEAYLVNHILRMLQRRGAIGAFVNADGHMFVTRISPVLKQEQAARSLP